MTDQYAYRFRRTDRDGYDHLCIDEGTAGLYTTLDSRYDVTIVTWDHTTDHDHE